MERVLVHGCSGVGVMQRRPLGVGITPVCDASDAADAADAIDRGTCRGRVDPRVGRPGTSADGRWAARRERVTGD